MKLTHEQRAQIEDLMNGAGNAGDREQVAICEAALDGDEAAQQECFRVISEFDGRDE